MKKKLISIILCLALAVSFIPTLAFAADNEAAKTENAVTAAAKTFDDVSAEKWFAEAVAYVTEKGLMNGISDSEFNPAGTATRGMVVTVLYRIAGSPEVTEKAAFTDVPDSAWYADAVSWASKNGIVKGVSDKEFAPDKNITREQLASIIYRYAQSLGEGFTGDYMFNLEYADKDQISEYAQEGIMWCTMNGIINGKTETAIAPKDPASRAEIASILMRFNERNADGEEAFMPENFLEEKCKKDVFESYDEIIGLLEKGNAYAYIELQGYDGQMLAIAESVYDNLDGNMASIETSVYYKSKEDGKVYFSGNALSGGTAYPIACQDGILYTAGNHMYESYFVSEKTGGLMVKDYICEEFDKDGKATYSGFLRSTNSFEPQYETEVKENDAELFQSKIKEYTEKKIVNYTVVK